MAAMEERQQEVANTMRELVEEAKDMTRQYYETQLEALRSEVFIQKISGLVFERIIDPICHSI